MAELGDVGRHHLVPIASQDWPAATSRAKIIRAVSLGRRARRDKPGYWPHHQAMTFVPIDETRARMRAFVAGVARVTTKRDTQEGK